MSKSMQMESSIIPPTPERMRHGEIVPYERDKIDPVTGSVERVRQAIDSQGRPGAPWEAKGILQILEEREQITSRERVAGYAYMDDWDMAGIENLRAAPFEILGKGHDSITEKRLAARERWWAATQAMGGLGSPCERAAWWVLGHRASIAQWLSIEGGRLTSDTAKGLLIGALGVLAQHYGLEPKKSGSIKSTA